MILYGLKTCDTCRKALKTLKDAEFRDVRSDGVPGDVMQRALEVFGENLLNRRSTTWRALSPEQREIAPAALLAQHPALMKRPLIDAGGRLYLGWSDEVREALSD